MDEFIVIKVMNEAMLRLKKSKDEDSTTNEKIKEYLNDEGLFFKIRKDIALKILLSVGVSDEKVEESYKKLIQKSSYEKLLKEGKLKLTDNLTIKYN